MGAASVAAEMDRRGFLQGLGGFGIAAALQRGGLLSEATVASRHRRVLWGAMVGPLDGMPRFISEVGATPEVHVIFSDHYPGSLLAADKKAGILPMIAWQPSGSLREVADGQSDAEIHAFARRCAEYDRPIWLRPWREMTGYWYPWGFRHDNFGDRHARRWGKAFCDAWVHTHERFARAGAHKVSWLWCADSASHKSFDAMHYGYPGDAYVDYTGFDCYNNNDSFSTPWAKLSADVYSALCAMSDRHIVVAEFASCEYGPGVKAAWITDAFSHAATSQRRIAAMCYFNGGGQTKYDGGTYPLNTSTSALDAFKAAVKKAPYG